MMNFKANHSMLPGTHILQNRGCFLTLLKGLGPLSYLFAGFRQC